MNSFETLLPSVSQQLHATALKLTKHPQDADDLFQDTMVKALTSFEQFQAGTNFGGWMNQIMHTMFISNLRKKQVRSHDIGVEIEDWQRDEIKPMPSAEEDAFNNLEGNAFVALRGISKPYAQAVYLADVMRYTREEIATLLDIPIATVGSRLARGRKALRETLGVSA